MVRISNQLERMFLKPRCAASFSISMSPDIHKTNKIRLTIQAFARAIIRVPRFVRASTSIGIEQIVQAVTASRANITSSAASATCAIGARKGGVAELEACCCALVGIIACCLRSHNERFFRQLI